MDDKFLKVMLFGSPFKKKLMKRPLLGYALVGYSLGFWGYSAYRTTRDYIELQQEEKRYTPEQQLAHIRRCEAIRNATINTNEGV